MQVESVLVSLIIYGLLCAAFFGWGKSFLLAIQSDDVNREDIPVTFLIWAGWAVCLFVFQLINFFFPVNIFTVTPVFLIGVVLCVVFLARLYREKFMLLKVGFSVKRGTLLVTSIVALIILLLVLLVSAWIATRAMLPPTNYDSGLYHFGSIRWENTYPIIPGLGNLHGRFAFNQSFFTYVAALNFFPYFGHGSAIANSFLWLLTLLTLLEVIFRVLRRSRGAVLLSPLLWLPALFCLPVLVFLGISSQNISSPTPDLTSTLLQIILFVVFIQLLGDNNKEGKVSLQQASIIFLLGATAITIKLSNIVFSGTIMMLILLVTINTFEKRAEDSVRLVLPAFLVILVFCVRGIILSGAPLYPSTLGYIETKWSVPISQVIHERDLVYSWARLPNVDSKVVLSNWNWFYPWLKNIKYHYADIIYPLVVFIAIMLMTVRSYLSGIAELKKQLLVASLVLSPLILGLLFWFVMAPDPRFANALFFLLPIAAAMLHLKLVKDKVNSKTFVVNIVALFIICNFAMAKWAYVHKGVFIRISYSGWQAVREVPLVERVTASGLRVNIPKSGDQCWDAQIPCTPYFNNNLHLISPPNLISGFTVLTDKREEKN